MALAILKNKHRMSLKNAVVNTNQEEVRLSCSINHKHKRDSGEIISSIDSINDSVLITDKHEKVYVFDEARALSKTDDHSNKSKSLTNKKVLVLSNTNNHSKNSDNPSKNKALTSSNTTDNVDKSTGPSTKKAVASSNHPDETSDKENETNNNRLQLNERILYSVAAPIAQEEHREDDLVPIGSGRTLVPWDKYREVNWKSYSTATRTLLRAVFSREVLSTHSLSGKRSPAFPDRPAKMCLDQQKVIDIIIAVKERFVVEENIIRSIITSKCADESKLMKTRQMKQKENEWKKIIARKCSDEREWRKMLQMEQGDE